MKERGSYRCTEWWLTDSNWNVITLRTMKPVNCNFFKMFEFSTVECTAMNNRQSVCRRTVVATRTWRADRPQPKLAAVRLLILSLHLRWWLDDTRSMRRAILTAIYHAAAAGDINRPSQRPDRLLPLVSYVACCCCCCCCWITINK